MKQNRLVFFVPVLTLFVGNTIFAADFGKGVEAYKRGDYAAALDEFYPLAEQGHARAQFNLGVMYRRGIDVPQNTKTAVKWYTLAAKQELAPAQFLLGSMYLKGDGVTQDYKAAIKWFTLAAEQGNADARYYLGVMYRRGKGVHENYVHAHMWWNIAASSGDKMAAKSRDIIAKEMSHSQIKKAQILARKCVKKKYKDC